MKEVRRGPHARDQKNSLEERRRREETGKFKRPGSVVSQADYLQGGGIMKWKVPSSLRPWGKLSEKLEGGKEGATILLQRGSESREEAGK